MKHKSKGYVWLAFHTHTDSSQRNHLISIECLFVTLDILTQWKWLSLHNAHTPSFSLYLSFSHRCLLLWPLHHHYLCKCWSSGYRKPDTSFPVCLQAKLHSSGLSVSTAVHRRAPSLHRTSLPCGVRTQIFPLQRCSTQLLFSHLHSGRKLFWEDGWKETG